MGWDYHTFESQPQHFIEEVNIFLSQESKKSKDDVKKAERSVSKRPRKQYSRR